MKNASRISARRVLQGGAAFAALGALTLGAASPAHADTYGWAYASSTGADTVSETYITQEQTVSQSFTSTIGDWLTVEGTTTATVDANGASATTVINTAKVSITSENIEDVLDPDEDDDEGDDEDEDEKDSEDETEDEAEGDGEEAPEEGAPGDSDGGEENDGESGTPGGGESDGPGDEPTEEPVEEPSAEPTAPADEDDEDAEDEDKDVETASADVIELNEENSELVDGGATVIIEGTITGATVTTTQSWDGEVSHSSDVGTFTPAPGVLSGDDGEPVELELFPAVDQGVVQTEDAGFLWNDAYTDLYLAFAIDGEVVQGYSVAESAAGITIGQADGGDNGGDNGDGGGDGKNPPQKERDKDTLPEKDVKDAEPLAQTGSPLAGLIAAGAAIAAGGGAAAYLARRKKKNGEDNAEATETTES